MSTWHTFKVTLFALFCHPGQFLVFLLFFFFNDTATTEIYTLSLHDALPISRPCSRAPRPSGSRRPSGAPSPGRRSEEHTSELQSQSNLVCRLLLEKKKTSSPTYSARPLRRSSTKLSFRIYLKPRPFT